MDMDSVLHGLAQAIHDLALLGGRLSDASHEFITDVLKEAEDFAEEIEPKTRKPEVKK